MKNQGFPPVLREMFRERVLVTGITGIHGWPLYSLLSSLLPPENLFGIGPPRIGNVALDSSKIIPYLSSPPRGWKYGG